MTSEFAVAKRGDILLLSRYGRLGASSRVRAYQYLNALSSAGLNVTVCPLFSNEYVAARHRDRRVVLKEVIRAYPRRVADMLRKRDHYVVWLEYELLPWLPYALERLLLPANRVFVVDYDDAVFHRYEGHRISAVRWLLGDKIARIMRAANVVIACNEYIADRARTAGARKVEIIPSVIDIRRYRQKQPHPGAGFTVGWIGSPSTTPYLRDLEAMLRSLADVGTLHIVNVGGHPWTPLGLSVETIPWSEDTEVDEMLRFDVGIMPLPDDPWTRGKCGYKLVQYMGCGLPAVASPVGVNIRIVDHGITGFLATTHAEWAQSLRALALAPEMRFAMGQAAREKAERVYSLQVTVPRITSLFKELVDLGRARSSKFRD